MTKLQEAVQSLKTTLTNKQIKRMLFKNLKTQYRDEKITKRDYKQSKKLIKEFLR